MHPSMSAQPALLCQRLASHKRAHIVADALGCLNMLVPVENDDSRRVGRRTRLSPGTRSPRCVALISLEVKAADGSCAVVAVHIFIYVF